MNKVTMLALLSGLWLIGETWGAVFQLTLVAEMGPSYASTETITLSGTFEVADTPTKISTFMYHFPLTALSLADGSGLQQSWTMSDLGEVGEFGLRFQVEPGRELYLITRMPIPNGIGGTSSPQIFEEWLDWSGPPFPDIESVDARDAVYLRDLDHVLQGGGTAIGPNGWGPDDWTGNGYFSEFLNVPEPSVIWLIMIGQTAFFLQRRRTRSESAGPENL